MGLVAQLFWGSLVDPCLEVTLLPPERVGDEIARAAALELHVHGNTGGVAEAVGGVQVASPRRV